MIKFNVFFPGTDHYCANHKGKTPQTQVRCSTGLYQDRLFLARPPLLSGSALRSHGARFSMIDLVLIWSYAILAGSVALLSLVAKFQICGDQHVLLSNRRFVVQ